MNQEKEFERHNKILEQIKNANSREELPNITVSTLSTFLATNVYFDNRHISSTEFSEIFQAILDYGFFTTVEVREMFLKVLRKNYPDKTEENVMCLANFFYNDTFFEESVLSGKEVDRQEEDTWFYRVEGCDTYNINSIEEMVDFVENNFEYAYSAFQTAFILDYANRFKPYYEVFRKTVLSNRLIRCQELVKLSSFMDKYHLPLEQEYMEDGQRLSSSQLGDDGFIEKNENSSRVSRLDAIKIAEVFLQTPYNHSYSDYSGILEWSKMGECVEMPCEDVVEIDFKELLTDEVKSVIDNLDNWFLGKGCFCDVPMEHLWLELILNQFGHPYHTNVDNHKRYSYRAKTRRMCVDIFTLDKCRALYDWIPMLEYFIHDMQDVNRHMITRMCIDNIGKHLLHIVDESYFGAALVGINELDWSKNKVLPKRIELIVNHSENPV